MKLSKVLLVSLCLLTLAPQLAFGQNFNSANRLRKNADAIPGHYIVVFNESVPAARVEAFAAQLAQAHGGKVGFTYQSVLRGFSVEMSEAQADALSRNPHVEYVEQDVLVEGASVQNSPAWPLDRLDQRDLPLNAAYHYATSGAGANAYVIDSGIRMTHQEFGGRALLAYDNVGDGRNGVDCSGHGTHVAGIIGGSTYGVAKGVKLHSVRVLNCSNQAPGANIVAGMDWVAANSVKPAVANLSFITVVANNVIDLAVRNLVASGVTTVVAAGNNNTDVGARSPARVTEAITVAASDMNDNRASSSNFGAGVDVFAPGVDIVSAWSVDDAATNIRSGTSSAAPFVAGLVARYLASRPGDQPDAVSQAIRNAATPGIIFDPGAGTPNLLAYAGITLSDDFNDNLRDAVKWITPTDAHNITVSEVFGRLEIAPGAAATNYDGYHSATNVDLTDTRISVEASTAQRINGFGSYFVLTHSTGNSLSIGIGGQNLVTQMVVGGVATTTPVLYDALQHRFWRIRHNRTDDTINWEAGPDGVKWIVLRTAPRPFSITSLQIVLTAGKWAAATPTTTAIFDNLWQEANPTPAIAMADNFNDNVVDPALWAMHDATSPTSVAEQNGRIEVTPQPNTAGYNGLETAGGFDFRNKMLQVEVQPASQAGAVDTYFKLYLNDSNSLIFSAGANSLTCDSTFNGVLDRTQLTWDATIRHWRFRHDIDTNTVIFDTSADGVTWTARKTIAAGFALHSVRASVGAGASDATNAAPGVAVFDNFRLERYRPLFTQSDNFDDNARDTKKWNVNGTSGVSVVEQNGRLQITPPAADTGYDGYYSTTNIDLTDANVTVELVQPAGISTSDVHTIFKLLDTVRGHYLLFGLDSSYGFLREAYTRGYHNKRYSDYDPVLCRFLRFRHNRAAGSIFWDLSADGRTWIEAGSMPLNTMLITNLQIQLYAGKSEAAATANTAIFDNLRIEKNEFGQPHTGGDGGTNSSGGSGGSSSNAGTYNAVTDFSHTQNPTEPWAYGYKPLNGAFTLFGSASTAFGNGSNTWSLSSQGCCPMVTKNTTGSTYTYVNAPSVVQPSDMLNLHPGQSGERSVVRWTATAAGTHKVSGRFQGLDTGGTTSDVLITHNGITIFSSNINGYGTAAPFSLTRTVAAGDTIEFSAGYGQNLSYESDSTGMAAAISPTNDAPPVNAAPQVNAGLDATVNEGSTFSSTASFTDIDQTDTWTVTVDYGDGTGAQPVTPTQSKTIPLSHVYKDNATNPYTVTVTVTDSAGASSTDTTVVTVINAPPTPAITGAQSAIREETSLTLGSTVSDPGEADTAAGFTYLWTVTKYGAAWRDGSQSTFNFREWAGTYVVTLRVTDKDGAAGTASTTITVNKLEQNDNFDDNSRDTLRWYVQGTPGVTVAEQNGQLQVTTPGSSTLGYDGYYGRRSFDLMIRSAAVEAVQPAYYHGLDTYFVLEDVMVTGNRLLFVVGGAPGALLMEDRVNDTVTSRTQIPYDAVQHRFWRFRRDPVTDILNWETSPDGLRWTVRHTAPRRFSLTSMRAQLYAGRYTTTTPPMTAVFDNYRVEDVPQPPISFSDNFDDNLLDAALWTVDNYMSQAQVREQNQRLEVLLAPPSVFDSGISVQSASSYNFWNRTLQVEVPRVSQGQESQTYLRLSLTNSAYYSMSVTSDNRLICTAATGTTDSTAVTYSASAHRFWRFRHDALAHTINFEVSADGQAWTTLKTVPETYPPDSVQVVIGAWGSSNSTGDPSIFDNIKMEANQ